ncbi:hypothetical protein [Flavobacterium sp. GCM10023249]|uniref:hypothetical protein n=1 Tax=unclassified Flavobacterium TaxID=196869 RepID=UPI003615754F
MKNKLKTEILYFFTAIVLTLITFHFVFGLTNFKTENSFDINIHDTYFIINKMDVLPYYSIACLHFFYAIRVMIQKGSYRLVSGIFIILNLILILIFPSILSFADSLSADSGTIIYPPLSAISPVEIKENIFNTIYTVLYSIYIALVLFTAFGIYKLGKSHQSIFTKRYNSNK